jgi:hypothetical protein
MKRLTFEERTKFWDAIQQLQPKIQEWPEFKNRGVHIWPQYQFLRNLGVDTAKLEHPDGFLNEGDLRLVEALNGPHGYAIFKMMKAQHDGR